MSQKKYRRLRALEREREAIDDKRENLAVQEGFWEIIRKNWTFLLIIGMGVVLIYLNALHGDFVSDDYASITQNPDVLNPRVMFSGFNTMRIGTYLLAVIFGIKNPLGFHLNSLFLYLIFIILAFAFIYRMFGKKLAISTTLLFAFHPIHVEAVSWISGRIYIILAIYILLGLMAFIYYLETGKYKFLGWVILFFILGFLIDKPRPFSLIFLMVLVVFYFGWGKVRDKLSKFIPYIITFSIAFFILSIPYIRSRVAVVNSGYNFSESIFYNPFFQYPTGIAKYLQLLWLPIDLTLYHTMYVFEPWLNWLILLLFLAIMWYWGKKDKRYWFALMFILLALAPSMAPVKVSWLVAERYMFLGSLGFCLFLALLLEAIDLRIKNLSYLILSLLLVFYGIRVYLRNIDWQTNHNLWVRTVQYSWNSHNAWNNIGDDYDKLGQYDNAIKGFGQSYAVKNNYADAYHNQANIFFKIKRYDLARQGYELALKFHPGLYQSYISLTQVALYQGDLNGALAYANKLIESQPNNPQAYYVMGVVLAQGGKLKEAEDYLNYALQLNPNFTPAVNTLKQISAGKTQ